MAKGGEIRSMGYYKHFIDIQAIVGKCHSVTNDIFIFISLYIMEVYVSNAMKNRTICWKPLKP
jgi:hypothetical protein